MDIDSVGEWVLVTGAVGTAAMGLVEASKAVSLFGYGVATYGLGTVLRDIGPEARDAIERVYGKKPRALLEGAWRKGPEELQRVVRDGLRIALLRPDETADRIAAAFGDAGPPPFREAVRLLRSDALRHEVARRDPKKAPADAERAAEEIEQARERLARVETAIDARVTAAVAAGRDRYVHGMQIAASIVAVAGMWIVSVVEPSKDLPTERAILVGLFAVPIAPIAKDVVGFLNALRAKFATAAPAR